MDISNLVGVGKQMEWYDPEMVARTGLIGTQQNAGNLANQQTDWSNQRTRNFSSLLSKAYDPVSKTIDPNKLNELAAASNTEDLSQAYGLDNQSKRAQTAADISNNNMQLQLFGVKPYVSSWANQPMNQSTQTGRTPTSKDMSATGETNPYTLLSPEKKAAVDTWWNSPTGDANAPTTPAPSSTGEDTQAQTGYSPTRAQADSQRQAVTPVGSGSPEAPITQEQLAAANAAKGTNDYETPSMPLTSAQQHVSDVNAQADQYVKDGKLTPDEAQDYIAANTAQPAAQPIAVTPPAEASVPAAPVAGSGNINLGQGRINAELAQPTSNYRMPAPEDATAPAPAAPSAAPGQVPAQQSYWDYLETLNPDVSAMLGNAGGQGQGSTSPSFQLPPNAPSNIVSAYGWKLSQDANAGLGAPTNGKAYTVDEVNVGLANVEKAAAATVMSPMWAAVPHRDEKTGRLMPPDPQAVAKARADYAANEAKVITELGKTYGPAFAEKFKMDMDVVKTEMEKGKYDKEIKTTNAENKGLNQFASNLTTVGKESNLSGAIDPMTFENKAAMDKFSTQLSSYSKIKDWPKSAAEAVTFAKNVSVAEDMPENEAMLNLMTVLGANPSDRAALAMMMQRDGGVSSAVGAAFGQFLANNLTSRPPIGEFKRGMAFQNMWRGHTGASGTAPTFGDTSSPVPTADEGKAAGPALVPPPPAGSWYNTPMNNAVTSKTGVHYNVTQRDANGNAMNVVDMLNHPHAVTNVPGSPNVAIEPWQDQPMSQPTGPTNRSARRRAARARTNTKSTAKDPLGLGI